MGSDVHVVVHGGQPGLLEWTVAEVERLEARWSRFRPSSDVCRVNAAAGSNPIRVAPETIDLVERAVAMWSATDGRFDPTILRALEANGYDETFERVRARFDHRRLISAPPDRAALQIDQRTAERDAPAPVPSPGCDGIAVDRTTMTIGLPLGTALDLGGIGKGYAADLLVRCLLDRGASAACVGMGGDVRAAGDSAFDVPVEDPFDETRHLFTCSISNEAIVTSTRLFRQWTHRGRTRHHIIDPETGESATSGIAAVIARASEAWYAEALAKAALVAGVAEGRTLLNASDADGWLVGDDRQVTAVTR